MKTIFTNNAPKAIGPYSQAVSHNGLVYTSGQIALNPESGELVLASIEEETKQVMENMKAVLLEANSDFNSVIKATIFIKDMSDFVRINEVYATYFTEHLPARETVQVAGLPKNVNIEISMIAIQK